MNNKRQNNNFYKNRYLNLFNDFSSHNNINIDNDINFPKKIKPIDNDKFLNLQTNDYNYNKINIKRNQNKRNNFNKFLEYNNQINRNKRIIEPKEDLKKESESLSIIADDLYNYVKNQKKEKDIQNKIKENINDKDGINNLNKITNLNNKKQYYKKLGIFEQNDFRADLQKNTFNQIEFKAFKNKNNNIYYQENLIPISIESIDDDDNFLFKNRIQNYLDKYKVKGLDKANKMENEILNKEDSKISSKNSENNEKYDADDKQNENNSELEKINDLNIARIEENMNTSREREKWEFKFFINDYFNFSQNDIKAENGRYASKDEHESKIKENNFQNSRNFIQNEEIISNENNELLNISRWQNLYQPNNEEYSLNNHFSDNNLNRNENYNDFMSSSNRTILPLSKYNYDMNELNDMNEYYDINELNDTNELNYMNESNYMNELNYHMNELNYHLNQLNYHMNELNYMNELNESSFFSFDHHDYTINGSTDFSLNESNNIFNIQFQIDSLNDSLNNEEQNISEEILIYP